MLKELCDGCDYFIEAQTCDQLGLWNGSISSHITKMRELYDSLSVKPAGVTESLIDGYEADMLSSYRKNIAAETELLELGEDIYTEKESHQPSERNSLANKLQQIKESLPDKSVTPSPPIYKL